MMAPDLVLPAVFALPAARPPVAEPDPRMTCINDKQRRMLSAILRHCADNGGSAPTIRWLGEELDISSTSVVNYHLDKLVACGLIRRHGMEARGIEVLGATWAPPADLVHLVDAGEGAGA